ncbi:hypothetical protein N431DRAFT_237109 [Stipitochalara longipes BDJ]|nr:hypothetical protein N431DRAFT_237109 [Stipitochalara longipes BDJ]
MDPSTCMQPFWTQHCTLHTAHHQHQPIRRKATQAPRARCYVRGRKKRSVQQRACCRYTEPLAVPAFGGVALAEQWETWMGFSGEGGVRKIGRTWSSGNGRRGGNHMILAWADPPHHRALSLRVSLCLSTPPGGGILILVIAHSASTTATSDCSAERHDEQSKQASSLHCISSNLGQQSYLVHQVPAAAQPSPSLSPSSSSRALFTVAISP